MFLATFVTYFSNHICISLLFFTWINCFNNTLLSSCTTVATCELLDSLVSVHIVLDSFHHLAEVNILITTNLAVLIEELLCDVTLCQLEVTCTLSYSTIESTSL